MKALPILILAVAVLGGAVTINVRKEDDALIIETRAEHAQEVLDHAGKLISAADEAFCAAANSVSNGSESTTAITEKKVFYRIRNAAGDPASQLGAYSDPGTAIRLCPAGYCVFDSDTNLVYIAE